MALKSLSFNFANEEFLRIFDHFFERLNINREKALAMEKSLEEDKKMGEEDIKKNLFLLGSIIVILIAYIMFKKA